MLSRSFCGVVGFMLYIMFWCRSLFQGFHAALFHDFQEVEWLFVSGQVKNCVFAYKEKKTLHYLSYLTFANISKLTTQIKILVVRGMSCYSCLLKMQYITTLRAMWYLYQQAWGENANPTQKGSNSVGMFKRSTFLL